MWNRSTAWQIAWKETRKSFPKHYTNTHGEGKGVSLRLTLKSSKLLGVLLASC
jgi:hypothetical protein